MLAEFLDRVVGLAKDANSIEVVPHPLDPLVAFRRIGEEVEVLDAPPKPRAHKLAGYDDLVAALLDESIARAPEVYLSASRVSAMLDREDRHSVISIDLQESHRLKLCAALQGAPKSFQPKDAVKWLRLEMHGGEHKHVIAGLSRIDFVRTSTGKSHVEHGKDSLGRSVEAAVQQAKDVPEDFLLVVPVWTTSGFDRYSVKVQVGVYIDLDAQNVELRVLSDEVERVRAIALNACAKDLRASLAARQVPVFLGAI